MRAARLHGPRDLRVENLPAPGHPGAGQVLIGVRAVGICGSDLHTYRDGKIGDVTLPSPLVPGHEFSGIIEEAGLGAACGTGAPLLAGMRVAVDPAQPCGTCELCRRGHPNLCTQLRFCGLFPDDGALREHMLVPASTCFPLPEGIDDAQGALLEPLGVALHAVALARLQEHDTVSIHGAGPIGLLVLQAALLAGASRVFVSEPLAWRLALAERLGAIPVDPSRGPVAQAIAAQTGGRGVDVAFETGWVGPLAQEAADAVRNGGTVMLVGIPEDDTLTLKHSTARRKGLTFFFVRRMKHTYPQAIELVENGSIDVGTLVSHRFPLDQAREAFALNDCYGDGVVKVIIEI
ncbi:MAG TPA: alcohol dehydrogenase catalytic domain-containing protein [Chloroflexota bacterium]